MPISATPAGSETLGGSTPTHTGHHEEMALAIEALQTALGDSGGLAVLKSLYDAHTVLVATSDNTPAAVTMGASTFLARLASGNIVAATVAEILTLLDVPTNAQAVLDTLIAAKGDLVVGTANDTPAVLTVGANDTILMADSGATEGLKWVASATPSTQAIGDAAAVGTADTFTRGDHKHAMPSAADILTAVKTVDGAASGLDADLLDGSDSAAFLKLVAGGSAVENIGAVESNVNTVATTGATETLDTSVYMVHDCTMDQACTFTFSNPAPSGKDSTFKLILRGAFTPTFPASVDWGDATPPTYTTPTEYIFSTVDAGTIWTGSSRGKAFG